MKNNFIKKTLSTLTICALLPLNCLTTSANNCSDTRWKGGSGGCDATLSYVYEKNHAYSYASVKNNKGKTASDTQNWDRAEASVKAYAFKTDYSYYNCWN